MGIVRWVYVVIASLAVGAVANIVLFFGAALLFAGANGDAWVRGYFEGRGFLFVSVSIVLGAVAFPWVSRLRGRLV